MNFQTYFHSLGFNQKESEIFLTLYKLGMKPASVIAKYLNIERTNVYKTLLKLAGEGLVSTTSQGGVKHFFIPDISVIKKYAKQKALDFKKLENNFSIIETELMQHNKPMESSIPKIAIYDGQEGIKNIYNDILENVTNNKYIVIKFFASNTIESHGYRINNLQDLSNEFFAKLKKSKITIESYLGNGLSLMENIVKVADINSLKDLPAANSAVNIFIVGKTFYLLIFKENPFGLKIDSEDLAYAMHFLMENLKT